MSEERRKPWGKWYWGDWRKDARLRRCSYAARGLWIDMLSLMGGECDHFGCLTMEGEPLGAKDLEGLLGGSEREIQKQLDELRHRKVYSRAVDDDLPEDVRAALPPGILGSTIISRRMLRDKVRDQKDREIGSRGGNPKLTQKHDEGITQPPLDGLTPPDKAQRLEARGQSQRLESDTHPPARRRTGLSAEDHAEFESWYVNYPRKEDRGHAEKAWPAARILASLDDLIAGAKRYAKACENTERRYVALPATWLNGKRWADEGAASAANGHVVSQRRAPTGPPPPLPEGWDRDL